MNQQQPSRYVAKHSFQGNVAQSQLSFPSGAIIVARPNQEGAWWWGNCNGREGWFPPGYVAMAPAAVGTPMSAGAGSGMSGVQVGQGQPGMFPAAGQPVQQLMQQATFTSSVQQQQLRRQQQPLQTGPPPGTFGAGMAQSNQTGFSGPPPVAFGGASGQPPSSAFGGVPAHHASTVRSPAYSMAPQSQQGPPPASFGYAPSVPTRYEPDDPFAGLDTTPVASGSVAASATTTAVTNPAPQQVLAPTLASSLAVQSTNGNVGRAPPPRTNSNAATKDVDSAAAAMARLGVKPAASLSPMAIPSTSRETSPAPPINRSLTASRVASSVSSPPKSEDVPVSSGVESATAISSQISRTQKQETKEELQLRLAREQEEARLKAKMRQEKEEIKRSQLKANVDATGSVGGLGVSGAIESGANINQGAMAKSDFDDSIYFNPFDFLNGTSGSFPERKFSPIYRVPPFWALLNLNTYVHQKPVPPEKLQDRAAMYEQLAKSLSFVSYVCAETEKRSVQQSGRQQVGKAQKSPLSFLRSNHHACEACVKLITLLPHSAGASGATLDGLFLNFINVFLELISKVQPNQQLVLPGGWQQPDYTYLCLYIIRNNGQNRWSFTVCNTGKDGIQYHPASFDSETGKELKQLAMTVWGKCLILHSHTDSFDINNATNPFIF